jgi:hypothetical protein
MAFIRWKHNGIGGRQAYLVHAFRGGDGKPKQKVLAYLGTDTQLTPDKIAALKQKHPDLKINWDKITPSQRPSLDISTLSDSDLLRKIRHLRHEKKLSQRHMPQVLREFGLPPCSKGESKGYYFSGYTYGELEKALERGEPQDFYLDPEHEVAPALRKMFSQAE